MGKALEDLSSDSQWPHKNLGTVTSAQALEAEGSESWGLTGHSVCLHSELEVE